MLLGTLRNLALLLILAVALPSLKAPGAEARRRMPPPPPPPRCVNYGGQCYLNHYCCPGLQCFGCGDRACCL
jgi:hypothetical protein